MVLIAFSSEQHLPSSPAIKEIIQYHKWVQSAELDLYVGVQDAVISK